MKKPGIFFLSILVALCLAIPTTTFAEDDDDSSTKLIPGGYFLWNFGNVVKGRDPSFEEREHEYFYGLTSGLLLDVKPNERMLHRANVEVTSWFPYPRGPGANGGEVMQNARWDATVEEAKTVILLGDVEKPHSVFQIGAFVHKTNPDTRHFGEYLFRSMIYPALVFTNFNFPYSKLTGMHLNNKIGNMFNHDAFVLLETTHYPFFDLSLAYTASVNIAKIAEFGAGVNLRSVVPVRPSLTNPKLADAIPRDNIYWDVYFDSTLDSDMNGLLDWQEGGTTYTTTFTKTEVDSLGNTITTTETKDITVKGASSGQRGTVQSGSGGVFNPDGIIYAEIPHDYTIYQFSGTLVMLRGALYPLGLMGEDNPFKLSIYGETAVLGYTNYRHLYENRNERMPIMGGISLETPFVDVISAEIEVYGAKGAQSYQQRAKFNVPHPGANAESQGKHDDLDDDFKWMLYAKKQFPGFSLVALVGTDHLRRASSSGDAYAENLQDPSHWYWQFRFSTAIGK